MQLRPKEKRKKNLPTLKKLKLNGLNQKSKSKSWAKKLLNLFTQGLDLSEEERKQSLKELKEKEVRLEKDLDELKAKKKNNEQHMYGKKFRKRRGDTSGSERIVSINEMTSFFASFSLMISMRSWPNFNSR